MEQVRSSCDLNLVTSKDNRLLQSRIIIVGTESSMLFKFHCSLIRKLIDSGAEVHLAASQLRHDLIYGPQLSEIGAILHNVEIQRTGMNPFRDLSFALQLYLLFRKIKPDLVLAYTVKPVVFGILSARLARVNKRVALIVGLGYAYTGKATGKRAILKFITSRMYRFALARANYVCFQNSDDKAYFQQLGILPSGTPSSTVNGCGVDLAHFSSLAMPNTAITFLMIGRLLGDKGVREYVAAAEIVQKAFPKTKFLLLGSLDSNPDGISEAELQSWIAQEKIEWLGYQDDVRKPMAQCHVFVLPSYREGLPQSTVEALACGRPIITTNVPGCKETVIDGQNGYLVEPRNPMALAEAMLKLIREPKNIKIMGQQSRRLAETKFASEIINAYLIDILYPRSSKPDLAPVVK
jgi:glycosyltransferase involved in cell wall biosynthesis